MGLYMVSAIIRYDVGTLSNHTILQCYTGIYIIMYTFLLQM